MPAQKQKKSPINTLAGQAAAKRSLLALTGSALALPNIPTTADAATLPERSFSLQLSTYQETDLSASKARTFAQTNSRYSIPLLLTKTTFPIADDLAVSLDFGHERMSGASPWYVAPDFDGDGDLIVDDQGKPVPKVRLTGATIEDARTDVGATLHYYLPNARIDSSVRISTEEDYQAITGGLGVAIETDDKMRTWETSISVSGDTIEAVDADIYTDRPEGKRRKGSFSVYGGFTNILDKYSTFQTGVGFKMHTGYLTDAYKQVAFFDEVSLGVNSEHESRPDDRILMTWVARYRRYSEDLKGTLHLDYRLYDDNWGLTSHTVDTAWYRDLNETLQLIPSLRLYMQSEANFYEPYFSGTPDDFNFYSSDYRLSSYGALSVGIKLIKRFETSSVSFDVESYHSSDQLGLGSGEASPAIVDFYTVSLGFTTQY